MKKAKFFITTMGKNRGNVNPKAEEKDGYIDTVKGIQIGFYANRDDKGKILDWVATELSTGFAIGNGKTKKAALEFVTTNIDKLKGKLDDPGLDKYKEVIKKANAKVEKVPEFNELPTKAEPPKVADKCYAMTATEVEKIRKKAIEAGEDLRDNYLHDPNVTPEEAAELYNERKTEATKAKAPVHPKSMFKETNRDKRVKEMVSKLEDGVKEIFESGKYEHYLSIMSKFHRYSLNNNLLIAMQMPTATRVAGYGDWQKKFKRQVRKGEKGIQILGGFPSKRIITDENGEEKEIHFMRYKPVSVFDISQTDGEDLPEICHTIKGDVSGYDSLVAKLRKVSPVKIEFEEINNGANGYYHLGDKRIAIKSGMSQAHTIKTMVHEIAHSILHDKDNGNEKEANRQTMEVQAESVAYVVNQYLGLDTSDYSFGYIAGWGEGKEMKELKESLEVIRKTSDEIIKQIA